MKQYMPGDQIDATTEYVPPTKEQLVGAKICRMGFKEFASRNQMVDVLLNIELRLRDDSGYAEKNTFWVFGKSVHLIKIQDSEMRGIIINDLLDEAYKWLLEIGVAVTPR